jgi:hypothetical protein
MFPVTIWRLPVESYEIAILTATTKPAKSVCVRLFAE